MMTEEKKVTTDEKEWWEKPLWIYCVFATVLFLYCLFSFAPFWFINLNAPHGLNLMTDKAAKEFGPNEYGDSFGLVNALFSSLAFAGVIVTLVLQMKEMKAQREEMRTQSLMLDLQRESLDEQRKEMIEMQRVQLLHERLNYLQQITDRDIGSNTELGELIYLSGFIKRTVDEYTAENDIISLHDAFSDVALEFQSLSHELYRIQRDSEENLSLIDSLSRAEKQCSIMQVLALRMDKKFAEECKAFKTCHSIVLHLEMSISSTLLYKEFDFNKLFTSDKLSQVIRESEEAIYSHRGDLSILDRTLLRKYAQLIDHLKPINQKIYYNESD